jgi:hypothetical protein
MLGGWCAEGENMDIVVLRGAEGSRGGLPMSKVRMFIDCRK